MTLLTLFIGVGFKWPQILTLYMLGWKIFVSYVVESCGWGGGGGVEVGDSVRT